MPDSPALANTPVKPRSRVTLTRDIRGVPEGTNGVVKVANGLTWARYWVQFDNGKWIGSVSGQDLVREGDYDTFVEWRKEEASRPKVEAATAPAAGGDEGGAGAAGGAASRVPAHLLERSRAARARKASQGSEG